MDLKDRLKAARKEAGLSQAQTAKAANVDQATISNLERGKHHGSTHLLKIADALRVSYRWLSEGEGHMLVSASDSTRPAEETLPHESEYALIPQLSAKGENGNGYLNDHVEVKGGLAFKRDWLAKMKTRPENLSIIKHREKPRTSSARMDSEGRESAPSPASIVAQYTA